MNTDGIEVVEIPPCPDARLALERARLHVRVALLCDETLSLRHQRQVRMAEQWLDMVCGEIADEQRTRTG